MNFNESPPITQERTVFQSVSTGVISTCIFRPLKVSRKLLTFDHLRETTHVASSTTAPWLQDHPSTGHWEDLNAPGYHPVLGSAGERFGSVGYFTRMNIPFIRIGEILHLLLGCPAGT